jgi:hypothetical protein
MFSSPLDLLDVAYKPPLRKIVNEVPDEHRAATASRLREASGFFQDWLAN